MSLFELAISGFLAAAVTWAATRVVLRFLIRRGIYDRPNERSSHDRPTPRGGGLAVITVLLLSWSLLYAVYDSSPSGLVGIFFAALLLAGVSWLDDVRSQPVPLRLAVQFAAVGLGITSVLLQGEAFLVFQGLVPAWLDHLLKGLIWLWFINLFNFMDGADGITGIEVLSIGLGLAIVALLTVGDVTAAAYPMLLAACAAGFLIWNWTPSRIFLGDVGSVTLGYLAGWLLLLSAAQGNWAAALLLPLYYLVDATLTLSRRLLAGKKIWHGHKEHFYQKAILRGASHAWVSVNLLLHNVLLLLLAVAAVKLSSWASLIGAIPVVTLLMLRFGLYPLTSSIFSPATK